MTGRKQDATPPPPGGRAAERLRQFEEARGLRPAKRRPGTGDACGSEASDDDMSGDAAKPRDAELKPKPPKP